jgi:Holliday junction resolvase RusA-like endonuclease
MKILLDIKPLSINKCWCGRRFKTKDYLQYEKDIFWLLTQHKVKADEKILKSESVAIIFAFYLKSILKSDVDNYLKPLIDILVKNGFIKDDRYVTALHIYKIKSDRDCIEIEIRDRD